MILQYCSDLHLEFRENKAFLKANPLEGKGDILLLAGDIVPFAVIDKHKDFFNYISDHFPLTYWLPGNHEYYYSDITAKPSTLNEKIRDNIFLVNNISTNHEKIRLVFTTLWSAISPSNEWHIENGMSDFQVIKFNNRRFSVPDFNLLHANSINFLRDELQDTLFDKTVVVTHHVPTFQHYPLQYKNSLLNEAFAVELSPFIIQTSPDYWIYGHHHHNTEHFSVNGTSMLTNQLGYVKHNEHQSFIPSKTISL
jgi:predicted phosphohydrolase